MIGLEMVEQVSLRVMNNHSNLEPFGLKTGKGGAHLARTIMLDEISLLLESVELSSASQELFAEAIIEDNVLNKRSQKTRQLTYRHLVDLYSLDPDIPIFRTLLFLWQRAPESHSQLAALCAYSRDALFSQSAPFILKASEGQHIQRENLEAFIEQRHPDRFSPATLKSLAQNINSSWTQVGLLKGRSKKVRQTLSPQAGSVCLALWLGYLHHLRGVSLFQSEYMKVLECSADKGFELAQEAARKGWMTFKKVGNVVEVAFPQLLTKSEMEQLNESY